MSITRRAALVAGLAWPACGHGIVDASAWRAGALQGFVLGGTERDPTLLDAMASYGANLSRVFMRWHTAPDGFTLPDVDVRRLRALLDRAERLAMRLMVAGWFEGADDASFWRDAARRAAFVDAWRDLAKAIGDHPSLAGLDLLNEPVPPMPSGDAREAQALWRPLAAQTIAALREDGISAPIVFEPAPGANVLGLADLEPFDDPQIVYSIHFYTPHDITHQGVSAQWERRIPYPASTHWQLGGWDRELGRGAIDGQRLERELRVGRAFALRHGAVVQIGEFSCVRWAPDGSAARWVGDCLALFERYGWSWTYHEFRGWPGWDAEIASTDPDARSRSADAPVIRLLHEAMVRRIGTTR